MSVHPILELHCAAYPFLLGRDLKNAEARARLRRALLAVMKANDVSPPACLVETSEQAMTVLHDLIRRCAELGVNWSDVVACVNRDWPQEGRHNVDP